MKEIWKDVVGYEGLYQVSNLGRIKSKYRVITIHEKRGIKERPQKEIYVIPTKDKKGYYRTSMCVGNKHICPLVHRVVAQAFIPNPYNKKEINHIDGNKENNKVDNLEWVTHLENMQHASKNGLMPKKLRARPVYKIKDGKILKRYISICEASRQEKIHRASISSVARGKQKTCGGYEWRYC